MEPIGESLRQAKEKRSQTSKHIKHLCLAIISTALLILDWWLLRESLFGGQPASFWIWPVSVTALWVVAVSLFALVNPDRLMFFMFNALGMAGFLLIMPRNIYIFAGGLIFFLLSMLFQRRIQDEEKNQLNFSIRRTLSNSQSTVTYALLVLLGFMIYSNVSEDFNRDPNAFYSSIGQTAVRGVPYLTDDRSQYNLNQKVGDFFRRQAEEEYPDFNQVSADQQRILMEQIRQNFNEQFGINANENVTLRVAMTEIVTQRLREALGRFERFFPLIFTALIIALMRTFAFVFNWVVLFLSWVFYRILLATRFLKIEKETVEVEKLGV